MLSVLALLIAMCCTLIASSTLQLASVGIETVRVLVELVQSCEDGWKCVRCVPPDRAELEIGGLGRWLSIGSWSRVRLPARPGAINLLSENRSPTSPV